MSHIKENPAGQGGVIIQLFRAGISDYKVLAAREQRFFRQLQQAIETHDADPCSRIQADALMAQRRWMSAYDHVRLSTSGGQYEH